MSKHTKEPWRLGVDLIRIVPDWRDKYGNGCSATMGKNGWIKTIAKITHASWADIGEHHANGKRIVECVNACANIKNPSAIKEVIEAAEILLRRLYDREVPDCLFDYGDSAESVNQLRDFMHEVRQALNALNGE